VRETIDRRTYFGARVGATSTDHLSWSWSAAPPHRADPAFPPTSSCVGSGLVGRSASADAQIAAICRSYDVSMEYIFSARWNVRLSDDVACLAVPG
jgi:hypothetical protein